MRKRFDLHKNFILKNEILKNTLLIILLLSVFSCNGSITGQENTAEQMPLYHTWNSLNEMEYLQRSFRFRENVNPLFQDNPADEFFPWAGIVSHHILAHDYIDAWFSCLSLMRNVKRFFIISPDHYGTAHRVFSLTGGSWDSGFGFVESDRKKVMEMAESLDTELDPNVFISEHGISALMPYIKKYFPQAEVAAIVVSAESGVNTRTAGRLADLLENEFDEEKKKENFLIISSDFSHKRGIEETALNDYQSMLYLENTDSAFRNLVICDNRSGIYILDRLGKNNIKSFILYHTNSWEISNNGMDDITSYFFVLFSDRSE